MERSALNIANERLGQQHPEVVTPSMTVALLGLVTWDPAAEELPREIVVPIDIVGMRDGLKGCRLELVPGMAGDPTKRIINLKAAAIEVDESHADRRAGEGTLEARLDLVQTQFGHAPLFLEPFAIGDLAEKLRIGRREQSLRFGVLGDLALEACSGRGVRDGAPENIGLEPCRGAAHHLAKALEP